MATITIQKADYDKLVKKANSWDELEKEISEFYMDENGEYSETSPVREGDLTDIGEIAAMAFGFL